MKQIPVGTSSSWQYKLVSKGQVLKLMNGDKSTFIETKIKNFIGIINGKRMKIPMFANKASTIPYVVEITEEIDSSVLEQQIEVDKLHPGNLFCIDGRSETFMFLGIKPSGKLFAVNLANEKQYTIDPSFKFKRIKLKPIKSKYLKL